MHTPLLNLSIFLKQKKPHGQKDQPCQNRVDCQDHTVAHIAGHEKADTTFSLARCPLDNSPTLQSPR